jgi:hypothetical protein
VWGAEWELLQAVGLPEVLKKEVEDLKGGFICYDPSSIVYPSRNIVKVWVRWYWVDKEPIPSSVFSEVKDLPVCKALEVIKKPSLTKLYEINCKERVYKTIRAYIEQPKEGIYGELKQSEKPESFGYGEILPDGDVDIVWKILCK